MDKHITLALARKITQKEKKKSFSHINSLLMFKESDCEYMRVKKAWGPLSGS